VTVGKPAVAALARGTATIAPDKIVGPVCSRRRPSAGIRHGGIDDRGPPGGILAGGDAN
jgi:hypothetical protein